MEKYIGKPLQFRVPSGFDITIREQNGDDDETLSEVNPQDRSQENNIKSLNTFIASLVIGNSKTGKDFMTVDEVVNLKLRDKYYMLLKTRMHSLGNIVQFNWECDCGLTTPYKDDISLLDRDLSLPELPEAKHKDAIVPYKKGEETHLEATLSSGQKIRFKYMDGKSELFILEQGKTKLSKNTDLYARDLSLFDSGEWVRLSSFNVFGAKAMKEIRALIGENDEQFNMTTECKCPGCGSVQVLPYNAIKDFFFPTEI